MVVFVDLEDALPDPETAFDKIPPPLTLASATARSTDFLPSPTSSDEDSSERIPESQRRSSTSTPNRNAFSAALSCYPIVKEIARAVDLNTLHALARTCRQFHANLSPFRHQLVRETLRCENEYIETVADMLGSGTVLPSSVKSVLRLLSQGNGESGRMTRGKVGKCARDMVDECRRCSKVVCRNCIIKPPSQTSLKGRLRRLCRPCGTAPLSCHLSPTPGVARRENGNMIPAALAQGVCKCDDEVWLCTQCGQTLRSNDTTYRRVWAWRTRYSTYLGGGLGTGIGEGCQGVKCGRSDSCIAAQEIELEVDCEADEASSDSSSTGHSPASHPADSHDEEEPGYSRQEVIGLGGVVKHKAKKRVMVGACVVEYEDERETGRYLYREEDGSHRAWCGWCSRVIPARNEAYDS